MRQLFTYLCFIISIYTIFCGVLSADITFPVLTGPYLGQMPPGMTAKLFSPGIFIKDQSLGCSGFLKDGTVLVFTCSNLYSDWRLRPMYITQLKDGKWTEPQIAPFNAFGPYNFTVGPDGETLYFTSLKSPDKSTYMLLEQANIWAVKLEKNGWTKPIMFGTSLNTDQYYENYPSVTKSGTIYYMSYREDGIGKTDVYRSKNRDGVYAQTENLGPIINSTESDIDPFIDPDERYLIVCKNKLDGFRGWDLYIAFRLADDSWTVPVNMGDAVNSSSFELRPYVTHDGKYLFFTSNRPGNQDVGHIYWVDAGIIDRLKPKDFHHFQN